MNRFLRKAAERGARDLTVGYTLTDDGSQVAQMLATALNHHQERRHHMAEEVYRQVLASEPENRDALYLLSTLKLLYREFEEASTMLQHLTMAFPDFAEAWSTYGSALNGLCRHEEAIMAFHRALEVNPNLADAHYHLAQLHKALKEWDNAVMHYRKAVSLDRTHAQAYNELAECYYAKGEFDESMAACHSAIMIDRRLVNAYNNLGLALVGLGQAKSAEETFRTAIKLDPSYAEAYSNLGAAFLALGRPAQALEACIQANQLNDNLAIAHCTRGEALRRLGRLDEAMQSCQRAILIDPESAEALNGLGLVYLDSSMVDEAVAAFRKAYEMRHHFRLAFSNAISALKCQNGTSDATILEEAQSFASRFGFTDQEPRPRPASVKRIGLLVGFVEESPTAAAMEAFVLGATQLGLEVCVYANDASTGQFVEELSAKTAVWRRVIGLDDQTTCELIRDDKVDILIDLCGHSEGNRLGVVINHAAPIQVEWFGGYGTTGLPQVHACVLDKVIAPPQTQGSYSEKLVLLDRPWLCSTAPAVEAPIVSPPCATGQPFTFGSFNQTKKINRQVVAAWAEILRRVPESRLMIKSRSLASGSLRRQYLSWFRGYDVDPDRIVFRQATTRAAHFASFNQVDLCLDTFPANGALTTFESLWMGVPVVTLHGDLMVGRLSASLLGAVGMDEFVSMSPDEYIELAVSHASKTERLAEIRAGLRGKVELSPMCDRVGFVKEFLTAVAANV